MGSVKSVDVIFVGRSKTMRTAVLSVCCCVLLSLLSISARASEIDDFNSALITCNVQKAKEILIKSPDLIKSKSAQGYTPLHIVALGVVKGDETVEMVRMLISRGADVNAADGLGDTPLHIAARNGCGQIARALLEGGAEINCRNKAGLTPLSVARENERYNVADLLNEKGGKE